MTVYRRLYVFNSSPSSLPSSSSCSHHRVSLAVSSSPAFSSSCAPVSCFLIFFFLLLVFSHHQPVWVLLFNYTCAAPGCHVLRWTLVAGQLSPRGVSAQDPKRTRSPPGAQIGRCSGAGQLSPRGVSARDSKRTRSPQARISVVAVVPVSSPAEGWALETLNEPGGPRRADQSLQWCRSALPQRGERPEP